MNRIDFLHSLYLELKGMPETERRTMLAPYEAAFREGASQGCSEEDVAQTLGDPAEIARGLLSSRPDKWGSETGDTLPAGRNNGSIAPPPNDRNNNVPPPNGWNGGNGTPPPGWQPARRGCLSTFLVGGTILLLNLCFVLGPVLGVYGVLFGGWCVSLGLSVGGVAAFVGSLAASTMPGWLPDSLSMATMLSGSVMMASAGLLLGMGLWYVTRWTFRLTGRYLKWTADLIFNKSA